MGCFLSKFKLGAVPPLQQAAIALVPPRGGLISKTATLRGRQGSGTKPDIYAFPLSIKSQTITAKRAGKAEKAVAANKFNAGT